MKILTCLLFLLAFVIVVFGQKPDQSSLVKTPSGKPCELTLKDAPSFRGLKLGMSPQGVAKVFGVERFGETQFGTPDKKDNGSLSYTYYDSGLSKFSNFSGVNFLELNFYLMELNAVSVKYSDSYADFSDEGLKKIFSEKFNLPMDTWIANSLDCKDFSLSIYRKQVTLNNSITGKKITEIEEKKRKDFQP